MSEVDRAWAAVVLSCDECFADLDEAISVAISQLAQMPGYSHLAPELLAPLLRRNLVIGLSALRENRSYTEGEIEELVITVEQRARQGVPLSAVIAAFDEIEQVTADILLARRVFSDDLMARLWWIRLDNLRRLHRSISVVHRIVTLSIDTEEQQGRAHILRDLLSGASSDVGARSALTRIDMDPRARHWVYRFAAAGGTMGVVPQLVRGDPSPPTAIFDVWGPTVVGLSTLPPPAALTEVAGVQVAVAGPVAPAELHAAFEEVTTCLRVMQTFGAEGVTRLSDLGLLPAVIEQPAIGFALEAKYVAPLIDLTLQSELLRTVEVYLEQGANRGDTAKALHLHPNSVRYRLIRFCELTGADLENVTTLAELWWLFRFLQARARGSVG